MRQSASKLKCRNCGGSSNVSYAPYPGTIPGAATGGRFICGDCLYAEENPGAKRIDRPLTGKAKGEARREAVLSALTLTVYGVPQPAGSNP